MSLHGHGLRSGLDLLDRCAALLPSRRLFKVWQFLFFAVCAVSLRVFVANRCQGMAKFRKVLIRSLKFISYINIHGSWPILDENKNRLQDW